MSDDVGGNPPEKRSRWKSFAIFLAGIGSALVGSALLNVAAPSSTEIGNRVRDYFFAEEKRPRLQLNLIRYNEDGTMKIFVKNLGTAPAVVERFDSCPPRYIRMWDRATPFENVVYDSDPPIYGTNDVDSVRYDKLQAMEIFFHIGWAQNEEKEASCATHNAKPGLPFVLRVLDGNRFVEPEKAEEFKVEPYPEYEIFSHAERTSIGFRYYCLLSVRADTGFAQRMFPCIERVEP